MLPASKAKKRANVKYNAKAYEDLCIRVSKGRKDELQARADAQGESLTDFCDKGCGRAHRTITGHYNHRRIDDAVTAGK